jgi:DNA-binding MarR family transcriptional regulator
MDGAVGLRRAEWLKAMRWRRTVEAALRGCGVTFTQWLVLDALETLIRETEDAVSHSQVAAHLELDRATIGAVMRLLERKGLVSHGDAYMSKAWRVILTHESKALLAAQRERWEAVSVRAA